ncbi:DNA glycosylase [Pseudocohnilembus persalinus]|uniref:DNA-(apurinic or apyrimidinic site) lyase n=1 Tax=Pseudocohnilembus persalinus TaxID=266149 RepID=A0A0V0QYY2_PSEPJ|nr:DNA glycosylase [Pseudocohnilembus persalinus]|eukprot:KRX07438.1 DNA glycosylase [Pseudocohnilembus persalinus]
MQKLINFATKGPIHSQELNLKNTLQNGQCFAWKPVDLDKADFKFLKLEQFQKTDIQYIYIGVYKQYLLQFLQNNEGQIYYNCLNEKQIDDINQDKILKDLYDYFQFEVDITKLCQDWQEKDEYFQKVYQQIQGLRLVRQEPFECFISFLISQNNNIPRITQCVNALKRTYGSFILELNGEKYYTFPNLTQISKATEQELRDLGLGYRAKYIIKSIEQLNKQGGEEYLYKLRGQEQNEIQQALLSFMGIGQKVADCISLFSMDCEKLIPVDTHVWQIFNTYYMKNKSKGQQKMSSNQQYEKVVQFFQDRFGDYAGWAHSYLFAADLKVFQQAENKNTGKKIIDVKEKIEKVEIKVQKTNIEIKIQKSKKDGINLENGDINNKNLQKQDKIKEKKLMKKTQKLQINDVIQKETLQIKNTRSKKLKN